MAAINPAGANHAASRDGVRQIKDPSRPGRRLTPPAAQASDPVHKDVDLRGRARDERAKAGRGEQHATWDW
jgi:hypothetical protein